MNRGVLFEKEHWIEFEGSPNCLERDKPRVTLDSRGVLLLNKLAYDALGMPSAVKLLYDEDRRVIGLKPEDIRRANAFPVKLKDKYHNRRISISPFCKHFGLDIRRTILFNEVDFNNDGVMKLELNKTITIGKAERR